jgi:dethiobiotin synthetase
MNDNGPQPPGLFIAGTDTGVGKTYVAALIAMSLNRQGYRVGVYKPAASGCQDDQSDDALALWEAAGRPGELEAVCPQRFAAPLAPHLAARAEGKRVDLELLRSGLDYWKPRSDVVLVEGAGGLLSPISDDDCVADLAYEFGYPLVVVAANKIGVINQALQTVVVAETFREGIPIAGIVLNEASRDPHDPSPETNYDELCRHARPPVLGRVEPNGNRFLPEIDWYKLAGPPVRG